MNSKNKKLGFLTLTSVSIFFISSMSAVWGHQIKFVIVSIVYFAFSLAVLKKKQELRVSSLVLILMVCIPFVLTMIPIHMYSFSKTKVSLLSSQAYWIGVASGTGYFFGRRLIKIAIIAMLLVLNAWIILIGYSQWINYVNYGSFSEHTNNELPPITLLTNNGRLLTNADLVGKITVLDVWNLRCGICFQKFPIFQEKEHKYGQAPHIQFIAMNIPFKSDSAGRAFSVITELGYTFPVVIAIGDSNINRLDIKGFPVVLIVNKKNRIIYKGPIENIDEILEQEISGKTEGN